MKNILQELYLGNISPAVTSPRLAPEYQRIKKKANKAYDKLCKSMTKQEKRQLEAMEAALDRARQYDELYTFITGFRLGGALTREAFADIDELVDYRERYETLED